MQQIGRSSRLTAELRTTAAEEKTQDLIRREKTKPTVSRICLFSCLAFPGRKKKKRKIKDRDGRYATMIFFFFTYFTPFFLKPVETNGEDNGRRALYKYIVREIVASFYETWPTIMKWE